MAKEELLEFPGTVSELLPNATFREHGGQDA
jgi:translation initiation factor IF-1